LYRTSLFQSLSVQPLQDPELDLRRTNIHSLSVCRMC
jgi:hypothetical protein